MKQRHKRKSPPYSLVLAGFFFFLGWMVTELEHPDGLINTTFSEMIIFLLSVALISWNITICFLMEHLEE